MKIGVLLAVIIAVLLGIGPARAETRVAIGPDQARTAARGSVDELLVAFGLSDLNKAARTSAGLPMTPVRMSCSPRGANTTKHCDCAATCVSVWDDCICCGGPGEKACKDIISK